MKKLQAFLVTWVTHNSRISERMIYYKVKKEEGFFMEHSSEKIVTESIAKVVEKDDLRFLAYNICGDHIHIILVCELENLSKIVQKLKSISAKDHNLLLGISQRIVNKEDVIDNKGNVVGNKGACSLVRGYKQNSLWAQKFHFKELPDEDALSKAVEYVRYNRIKHKLSSHHEIHETIKK